ncbi:beta family protein [Acinetobacter sp.]|uniref:beta family protein n=1 Tax=Acinetobacter sp. TaxID=472 RepID=UPI002FCC2C2D
MISINFESYSYYPVLRTRPAELKGIEKLDDSYKSQILPLFTLGKWPKAQDFKKVANKVSETFKYPFILDLTTEENVFPEEITSLKNSENNFENWINFCKTIPNVIPVVQKSQQMRLPSFVKQAENIEKQFGKLAFRIKDYQADVRNVISALAALDDPENAITFIDAKYIRNSYAATVAAVISIINQIRTEVPEAIICILATSFPASVASYAIDNGQRGSLEILERQLHTDIGGSSIAIYGDYASIHGMIYDDAPQIMRWAARVDYPKELTWYFERIPKGTSKSDFEVAAERVLALHPEIEHSNLWGEQMIYKTAKKLIGKEIGFAPASWIAVRVNIHLVRQIDFSKPNLALGEEDEELDF